MQFLLESTVLAASGGVTGIVAGLLVSAAASVPGRWDLAIPWWAALVGLVLSIVFGLSLGVIPASRALRLEPTVALRSGAA